MKITLESPDKLLPGEKIYQIKFELETVDESLRERVLGMIVAAIGGASAEVEEKTSALGFHKEEEE